MVAPHSTFALSSYTQRPIFQDHFIKTGIPLQKTIHMSSKRKNNDTQNIRPGGSTHHDDHTKLSHQGEHLVTN